MEQESSATLRERQVPQFIQDDKLYVPLQSFCEASGMPSPLFLLQLVDQIDDIKVPDFVSLSDGMSGEGGQVPINGKCCQLHLIMNRLGFSMRKFCLSERAAHFFKAALALFVLGQNIVPGGGHAVEFKSLQKGHELSFFMHTLLLTCSARRHSVHNQRWAAASGKAALALPQPPGQDWFAAGRGCSGGRRR